jgi:membrane-bound lytic murein transglycosylase B
MKPTRDVQPFLDITAALGRDPYKTVVSCPQSIGYGGAMGPAQFIPSTWKLFASRLSSALGVTTADPWRPQDAFMASGMYLSDLGASGGYTGQIRAACKYYGSGGSSCAYGTQVMARVQTIQNNIDIIQAN